MPNFSTEMKLFGLDFSKGLAAFNRGSQRSEQSRSNQLDWLRPYLDQPVKLYHPETRRWQTYLNGQPAKFSGTSTATGLLLPAHAVLVKTLFYPVALQQELPTLLQHEIPASSPFPEGDTVHGYAVTTLEHQLQVHLLLASRTQIQHIASQVSELQTDFEVWAPINQQENKRVINLRGFNETQREGQFKQRVSTVGYLLAISVFLLFLIPLIPVAAQYKLVNTLQATLAQEEREARDILQARQARAQNQETLDSVNPYTRLQEQPLHHLNLLTSILNDDAWLSDFSINPSTLRISGRTRNAAALQATLSSHEAYTEVKSLSSIIRDSNNYERFSLELMIPERVGQQ